MKARTDIENAPTDGSTVILMLDVAVRAYWDAELSTWVLARPLHIESVRHPKAWSPA